MKLKILIYADSYNERIGQSLSYVKFLAQFGEVILVSAQNDLKFWVEHADVLALPGGADVDPKRYGEVSYFTMNRTNPHYEHLDTTLLPMWLDTKKPIIAICRGMQTLNVACGGTLFQDIIGHIGHPDKRSEPEHDIFSELSLSIDGEKIDFKIHPVNSYHHQAVKQLADGFEMLAWGPIYRNCPSNVGEDKVHLYKKHHYSKDKKGVISKISGQDGKPLLFLSIPEIIRHKTLPYIAFQYHPEENNCELARILIEQTLS